MFTHKAEAFPLPLGQKLDSVHDALEALPYPGPPVNGAFGLSSTLPREIVAFALLSRGPRAGLTPR
jgi:hypothetical protein